MPPVHDSIFGSSERGRDVVVDRDDGQQQVSVLVYDVEVVERAARSRPCGHAGCRDYCSCYGRSAVLRLLDGEAGVQGSDHVCVACRRELRCRRATSEEEEEFPGRTLEPNSGRVPESVAAAIAEHYL